MSTYLGCVLPLWNLYDYLDLQKPDQSTPFHIRGGYILPIQDPEVKNTVEQRETRALSLLAYLDR